MNRAGFAAGPDGLEEQAVAERPCDREADHQARGGVGTMFRHTKAFSGFSVDDLDRARDFYGRTLGLEVDDGGMGTLLLRVAGGTRIVIYPKPDHVPATFTILNFPVPDIEEAVDRLAAEGIAFERYEGELATDERGIFRGGGPLIAWFRDPAGNILSVIEEEP
jgi:catechol 2,3-dioxygenase-like lactoylglutathione lyase family enzyme